MRAILFVAGTLILCACGNIGGTMTPASGPTIDRVAFRACVDREAPVVFANAMKKDEPLALYGYHTSIDNSVISKCNPAMPLETLADSISTSNSEIAYVQVDVEAEAAVARAVNEAQLTMQMQRQSEEYDEKAKTQNARAWKARNAYYNCIVLHAKTLSLVSSETADIVAQAALSSCPTERAQLVVAMNDIVPSDGNKIADGLDANFTKNLLLEIVKARASRATPKPETKRAAHTPI